MTFRHCIALAALFVCCSAVTFPFDVPAWGGLLQNVAWPTRCITFTDTAVTVAACDTMLMSQYFDFTNFQNYATTPGVIPSLYNSKVLEVSNSNPDNGGAIGEGTYDSNNITLNQQWKIINGAWDGTFELQAQHSSKCLNCEGVGGLTLDQWQCFGDPRQTWRVIQFPRATSPHHGPIRTTVGYRNGCLDNYYATKTDGAEQGISLCGNNYPNLHWYIEAVQGINSTIRNYDSNKCLQVNGGGTTYGARVTQWTCPTPADAGPANFYWNVKSSDPESYGAARRFYFEHANAPGMCLGIETYGSTGSIYPYWDAAANAWVISVMAIRPCVPTDWQLFLIDQPASFRQPYGGYCAGPLSCLSNNCFNLVCQKGGTGLPCQTKNDCTSGVCSNGNCA